MTHVPSNKSASTGMIVDDVLFMTKTSPGSSSTAGILFHDVVCFLFGRNAHTHSREAVVTESPTSLLSSVADTILVRAFQ